MSQFARSDRRSRAICPSPAAASGFKLAWCRTRMRTAPSPWPKLDDSLAYELASGSVQALCRPLSKSAHVSATGLLPVTRKLAGPRRAQIVQHSGGLYCPPARTCHWQSVVRVATGPCVPSHCMLLMSLLTSL